MRHPSARARSGVDFRDHRWVKKPFQMIFNFLYRASICDRLARTGSTFAAACVWASDAKRRVFYEDPARRRGPPRRSDAASPGPLDSPPPGARLQPDRPDVTAKGTRRVPAAACHGTGDRQYPPRLTQAGEEDRARSPPAARRVAPSRECRDGSGVEDRLRDWQRHMREP